MGQKLQKFSRGGLPTPPPAVPARRKLIRRGKKMISKEGGGKLSNWTIYTPCIIF